MLKQRLQAHITPVALPKPTANTAILQSWCRATWIHSILVTFDVLAGAVLFRRLHEPDVQYLTISSRVAVTIYRAQHGGPYTWRALCVAALVQLFEKDHLTIALRADYARGILGSRAALRG